MCIQVMEMSRTLGDLYIRVYFADSKKLDFVFCALLQFEFICIPFCKSAHFAHFLPSTITKETSE